MEPNFNIDRPRITDEEIDKHKDFNQLVNKFKQQSLQKAKHDKSWWKDKKVRYTSVIAGITVICTITYFSIINNHKQKNTENDNITTQNTDKEPGDKTKEAQEAKGKVAFVNAPSNKYIVPYSSYKVNNSTGGEIKHTSNSKIRIPLNSFVDKSGKDIIGDVVIEYREFQDKGDIIASGIPMAYDSAGKKYNLESAGMFDVKGTQNGEPVFIKPGKDLTIELASNNADDRFNQYYLDTVERNWKYIKKDIPLKLKEPSQKPKDHILSENHQIKNSTTPKLESLKSEIETVLPKKIDSVKVVYTKKAEALPKPKEPFKPNKFSGRPTFLIEANSAEFPELIAFGNVTFEVGAENKNYSKEMHEITWNDVKVSEGPQKGKNYILALTYRGRTEKLIVYPVFKGDDFERAQKRYEKSFETYQGLVEKREADEKRLMAEMETKQKVYLAELQKRKGELAKEKLLFEAKMQARQANEVARNFGKMNGQTRATRIFEIAKFGIYNSDCAHAPEGKTVSPVFVLNAKDKPLFPEVVYLVNHDQNSVYSYARPDFSKIQFKESATNSFLIFVNNKAYLCNKNGFKDCVENDSNKFTVIPLPENADNLIDFKNALEI